MSYKVKNDFMLVLTALIWGCAFVAQSIGMEYVEPFTFNTLRCFLGAIVLMPLIFAMDRKRAELIKKNILEEKSSEEKKKERRTLIIGGICCGAALTLGTSLQQMGLVHTTAGKAGFITALYILIVPVLGIFVGKKAGGKVWIGVAIAVAGMYLLCVKEGFTVAYGDFLVFLCAIAFSLHILVIDYFSPKVDGVKLSCIQFLVCGILSGIVVVFFENPDPQKILQAWLPILYAGVLSCGVAYTLQIVAQKGTDPTVASLILSLESVFAALAGWIILGERLSAKEFFGCVLVFAAIILVQLPEGKTVKRVN